MKLTMLYHGKAALSNEDLVFPVATEVGITVVDGVFLSAFTVYG